MSKVTYFRHCRMERKQDKSTSCQHSWIPEEFAKVGKVLKLKNHKGEWENGWVVTEAGSNRLAENVVPDYHDLVKRHRQATGDALPKK